MRQLVCVLFAGILLMTVGSGRGEAAGPVRNWVAEHRPGIVFPKPVEVEKVKVTSVVRVPQPMPARPAAPVPPNCLNGNCPLPGLKK